MVVLRVPSSSDTLALARVKSQQLELWAGLCAEAHSLVDT